MFGWLAYLKASEIESDMSDIAKEIRKYPNKKAAIEIINKKIEEIHIVNEKLNEISSQRNKLFKDKVKEADKTHIFAVLKDVLKQEPVKHKKLIKYIDDIWEDASSEWNNIDNKMKPLDVEYEKVRMEKVKLRQQIYDIRDRNDLWGIDFEIPY